MKKPKIPPGKAKFFDLAAISACNVCIGSKCFSITGTQEERNAIAQVCTDALNLTNKGFDISKMPEVVEALTSLLQFNHPITPLEIERNQLALAALKSAKFETDETT